jgi:hypothetical protein
MQQFVLLYRSWPSCSSYHQLDIWSKWKKYKERYILKSRSVRSVPFCTSTWTYLIVKNLWNPNKNLWTKKKIQKFSRYVLVGTYSWRLMGSPMAKSVLVEDFMTTTSNDLAHPLYVWWWWEVMTVSVITPRRWRERAIFFWNASAWT